MYHSEQFKTIQNQVKLEAIADTSGHPVQTVTWVEITPRDITLEFYPSIKEFENKVMHNKQETIQGVDSTFQTLLDSLLTKTPGPEKWPSS